MNNLSQWTFLEPWWLLGLLAIPILVWFRRHLGSTNYIEFSSLNILGSLGSAPRFLSGALSFHFLILSITFGFIALARPCNQEVLTERVSTGIDIVLAIDVSTSMLTPDFERRRSTRMQAAIETASQFSKLRPNDRIGLVGFAGRPFVSSPITLEHEWLRQEISFLEPNQPGIPDGTAIGSAIVAAANRLKGRDSKSKVIILVTDGANNSGRIQPLDAAKLAHDLGIKIYTIAIGSPQGRLSARQIAQPKQEFDPVVLKNISQTTGGEFYHVQHSKGQFQDAFQTINQLEKTESNLKTTTLNDPYHFWFCALSLLSALIALILQSFRLPPAPA